MKRNTVVGATMGHAGDNVHGDWLLQLVTWRFTQLRLATGYVGGTRVLGNVYFYGGTGRYLQRG